MVCPVCDAEVCDHDVESCPECGTALATWGEYDLEFYARPLIRCCRCGECPSSGDRACRQCHAHFLKRAPVWLNAEFPGWTESTEWDSDAMFSCISCEMRVVLGGPRCEICGLRFYRPTEDSAETDLAIIREATSNLTAHPDRDVAPAVLYSYDGTIDLKCVPDPEPEAVSVPAAAATPTFVTTPTPATAQPTVGSVRRPVRTAHKVEGVAAAAAVIAARMIPPRAKLLAERQSSYKALIASGGIRPVLNIKWLSGQSVVCAQGHHSNFGLFACRPGYGPLDCLPDFKEVGWNDRLATALHVRGGAARDNINDRDPERDVRWSLGCPVCGTDLYAFEAAALRDYVMCTASADYWWVFCHLYRRDLAMCGNCEIRRIYWDALRSLE